MKRCLLILSVCTVGGISGYAQISYRFGIEYGHAFADRDMLGTNRYGQNPNINRDSKIHFGSSPLVGLGFETRVKYFVASFGIQYQQKKESYSYRGSSTNYWGNTTHEDRLEVRRFEKICFPVSLGLTIKIGKIRPAIFAGLRPNVVVAGSHYEKVVYTSSDPGHSGTNVITFDPTRVSGTKIPGLFYNQVFVGFSAGIGEHIKLSATINKGGLVGYPHTLSVLMCEQIYTFFNNDYVISISYFLNRQGGPRCRLRQSAGTARFL